MASVELELNPLVNGMAYTLVSSEGSRHPVNQKIVVQCLVLKDMLDFQAQQNGQAAEIPLKDVKKDVLETVIEFLQHYENEPPYVPPTGPDACTTTPEEDAWEIVFLKKLNSQKLFDVMLAANYLNIPRLIDAACFRLSYMITGRSVGEIRRIFQIQNDFTQEEEEELRREHLWYNDA